MTSTDHKFFSAPTEFQIMDFADRKLTPYVIRGGELVPETCPFCHGGDNGDKETFFISLRTGQYCCHRGKCGRRGGWLSLLKHFGEAGNIASVSKQFRPLDLIPLERTDEIDAYFANRGISKDTLDVYQISATPEGNIMFPFYVEGELIYAKYREPVHGKTQRKEWCQKNAPPVLFGMDLCDPELPLYITEGQIDALSLYEAGIRNVVSVPAGCDNFDWIPPCFDWLEQFDRIILFGDDDPPGRKMVKTLISRLGEDRCFVVEEYPADCKDANDILLQCGKDVLLQTASSAQEIPIRGVVDLFDIQDQDPTAIPRIKTMVPALDESIGGLEEGGITIFSGESGNGKSTLCGLLLLSAIEQGQIVCSYSGELTPPKFKEWLLLQCAGSDYITLKYDPVKDKEVPVVYPPAAKRIEEWLHNKCYLFVTSEDANATIADSIISVFTSMAKRRGAKLFLVDNLMTALIDGEEDEYRAQGKFMAELKRFAVKYACHVLVVAHPRKRKDNVTLTKDDISGAKNITNLASNVIIVEKPDLRIIKSRDSGFTRLIECIYCSDSRRVYQADVGDKYVFSWDKTGLTPPTVRADSKYGSFRSNNTELF